MFQLRKKFEVYPTTNLQWRLIIMIKNEFVCVRAKIDYAVLGGVTVRHIGHEKFILP